LNAFDEALNNLHSQRTQKLKVDKVLTKLSNGTEEQKEISIGFLNALKNKEYNDQTICDALENIEITVSLSAIRNWRIRNNVER
jgi:hypothetical protein